jgi:hypothetical protein
MCRVQARANIGSIPEVVPAISEMVPVGATEVSCPLRSGPMPRPG